MKIALPHLKGNIYGNLLRTGQFIIYEVEGDHIVSSRILITHMQGAKGLAKLLVEDGVEVVICTAAGKHGLAALDEECIEVVEGVEGPTEAAVIAYLQKIESDI